MHAIEVPRSDLCLHEIHAKILYDGDALIAAPFEKIIVEKDRVFAACH